MPELVLPGRLKSKADASRGRRGSTRGREKLA
jgi:hypothetical protein